MTKIFISYLLPPVFIDLGRFIKGFLMAFSNLNKIKKNSKFKNSKKGKTVYVIANGPSLNNFDTSSIYGKEVIVMNNFDLAEWKNKVSIVAHCIGEPNSSPHWGEDQIEIMKGTNALSYWYHISNYNEVEISNASLNKDCYFVASIVPHRLWNNRMKINLSRPSLGYQTTAQLALMVGLHMGYEKINLIGFDHDWLATPNISPHFYKERKGVRKADLAVFSYINLINISLTMWEIYYKIKSSAINGKTKIVNLSIPTLLDVFDFKNS